MKTNKILNFYIPIFIIVCAAQLIYLNSLSNQFVYDDEYTIVNNYFIKTWNNISLLFTRDYFKFSEELSYRPVVTLSYFIDYTLWKLNPLGFHLTNSILHTINGVLLFFLLARFLNKYAASFMGALIFVCHPAISETVNAISYREDLLAATFSMAAFILYLKTSKSYSILAYVASVVCYILGIFSKEMAITLPILLFLHDILLSKKPPLSFKLIRYYIGYILAAVFYLFMRFVFLHNPIETHFSYPQDSILINFLTMSKVFASYIKLFFFPFSLCADYVVPYTSSFLDVSFILSFFLLSSVIVIIHRSYFHSKILFFSMIWFFISLLPVANILPIENIMAERYLYLTSMGFCMLSGSLLTHHYDKNGLPQKLYHKLYSSSVIRWLVPILSILVIIIFSIETIKRNTVWMDQTSLWTNTMKVSPNSFKAHNNLGNIYRNEGKLDEAIHEFKCALTLYDNYVDAHNNLGVTYRKKGMLKEALFEYQKALQLNPHYPYAHNNLGVLYAKSNFLDQAVTEFTNAISYKPDYADAHNNLGATYIRKGLYEKAIHECLEAITYNKDYKDAYFNLCTAYFNNKQFDRALEASETVLSIDPNHRDARQIYNLICEQKGLIEKNK